MKTLHLMRHAKSSWDRPGLADRERGLNKRGKRDAPRMGRALAQRIEPQPVHVSPARRAQLTLEGLCRGWPALAACTHHTTEALYTFSADDIIDYVRGWDDRSGTLFLIGHNPALTDLVNLLTGRRDLDNLPTAGYAQLSLDIDHWRDLVQGCADLAYCLFPKQLGDT